MLAFAICLVLFGIAEWYPGLVLLWRRPAGRWFSVLLGLSAISIVVSTFLSVDPHLSLAGTTWRRYGAVVQLEVLFSSAACAGLVAKHSSQMKRLLAILAAAASLAALYGISQYFGIDPIFDSKLYTVAVLRPPATLGHAMYLATFLLPVTFITGAWVFHTQSRTARVLLFLTTVLSVVAILLSGTRSALLGLVVGMSVALVRNRSQLTNRTLLWLAIAATTVFVVIFAIVGSKYGETFRIRTSQWIADTKGGPRLVVWKESISLITKSPILGDGPETFAGQFRRIESAELAKAYPDYYHESPHNYFMDVAVSQGLSGLVIAVLLLATGIYAGIRQSGEHSALISGVWCGLIAMVTALQFVPLTLPNAILLYSLIALLVSSRIPFSDRLEWRPSRVSRLTVAVLVLAVSGVAVLYALKDFGFANLERKLASRQLKPAMHEYESLDLLPFPRNGEDLWLSRQLAAIAASAPGPDSALAISAARRASAIAERTSEERFNALYQSAALAAAAGDLSAAETKLRAAIREAPTWYKPRILLAQMLLLSHRRTEVSGKQNGGRAAGSRREKVENSIKGLRATLRIRQLVLRTTTKRGHKSLELSQVFLGVLGFSEIGVQLEHFGI